MGQQQLLLVILVTIIIAIATLVAVTTFRTAAVTANLDAVRQDMTLIGSAAQGYYVKPLMFGGGSRSFDGISFNDMAFPAAGISVNGEEAQNENGRYVITTAAGQELIITAHPVSDPAYVAGDIDIDGVLSGGTPASRTIVAIVFQDGFEFQ